MAPVCATGVCVGAAGRTCAVDLGNSLAFGIDHWQLFDSKFSEPCVGRKAVRLAVPGDIAGCFHDFAHSVWNRISERFDLLRKPVG